MPPQTPGTSYSGRPGQKLRLPKIGPTRTKSLFEEYFYTLLAVVFFAVVVLGKAGGFSGFNALVVGAWVTAFLWFAKQMKGYFAEKSKAEGVKTIAPPPRETPAQAPKGPLPLPSGMKPMIGPQWPVKPGARSAWPKLPKQRPASTAQTQAARGSGSPKPTVQAPVVQPPPKETEASPAEGKKQGFVYERPTLPDRKPKLPHNWAKPNSKKPKS